MNRKATCAALLITVAIATPALAENGFNRHDNPLRQREAVRLDRRGDHIDARFDRKADRVERHFDRRADQAEALGKYRQADRLRAKGERIARHFDRKSDRIEARLDHRGKHQDRRLDHRAAHLKQSLPDYGHRHQSRSGEYLARRMGGWGWFWSNGR